MGLKVPNAPYKVEWDDDGEFCAIPLSVYGSRKGIFAAKVDPDGFADLVQFNWHVWTPGRGNETHYARRVVETAKLDDGKRTRVFECMHNRILNIAVKDGMVDHINGNGLDNRIANLREATKSQNVVNSDKRIGNTTSKFKGVSKCLYRYRARICVKGQTINLGFFKTRVVDGIDQGEIDAAVAYDQAAVKYYGCFARLNFPEERNVVSLGGTKYRMVYLPSGPEKTVMEKKIQNLRQMKVLEIFQILGDKTIPEIEELCHYLSCGVDQLAGRIKMHDPDNPESVISLELQQREQRALSKER